MLSQTDNLRPRSAERCREPVSHELHGLSLFDLPEDPSYPPKSAHRGVIPPEAASNQLPGGHPIEHQGCTEYHIGQDQMPIEMMDGIADALGSEEGVNLTFYPQAQEGWQHDISPSALKNHRMWQTQNGLQLFALKEAVISKLEAAGCHDLASPLVNCGSETFWAVCTGCRRTKQYSNRCERTYCPRCQPRISRERQAYLRWWTHRLHQPKHVVLTVKNRSHLTQSFCQSVKKAFAGLRRSKFARTWKAGCWSLETTHEGRGWHLHLHCLIETRWIDRAELEKQWSKRVGQEMSIVRVYDVRETDYVKEVAKYVCKGSTLATLSPIDLAAYVTATQGIRMFGVFGELHGQREEFAKYRQARADARPCCPCGCESVRIMDRLSFTEYETTGRFPSHKRY